MASGNDHRSDARRTRGGAAWHARDEQEAEALAFGWLLEVDGRLMRRNDDPEGPDAWVAVVKTPAPTGRRAELIVGFGDTAAAAVETAQERWEHFFRATGPAN